jgi:hypothetical protein
VARPTKKERNAYPAGKSVNGESVAATLLRWNPYGGETFVVGWTAEYALPREVHDGYMRLAVGKWDRFVEANVKKQRTKLG